MSDHARAPHDHFASLFDRDCGGAGILPGARRPPDIMMAAPPRLCVASRPGWCGPPWRASPQRRAPG
eukprot:5178536-Pyramimonas_sp.AAC.1